VFTFAVTVLGSSVCSSFWIVFELCTIWEVTDSTVTEKFLSGFECKNQSYIMMQFLNTCHQFDVHVAVHCDKFLIIKPTRCINFSNLFLE